MGKSAQWWANWSVLRLMDRVRSIPSSDKEKHLRKGAIKELARRNREYIDRWEDPETVIAVAKALRLLCRGYDPTHVGDIEIYRRPAE